MDYKIEGAFCVIGNVPSGISYESKKTQFTHEVYTRGGVPLHEQTASTLRFIVTQYLGYVKQSYYQCFYVQ